jgi:hypothetical protein
MRDIFCSLDFDAVSLPIAEGEGVAVEPVRGVREDDGRVESAADEYDGAWIDWHALDHCASR